MNLTPELLYAIAGLLLVMATAAYLALQQAVTDLAVREILTASPVGLHDPAACRPTLGANRPQRRCRHYGYWSGFL